MYLSLKNKDFVVKIFFKNIILYSLFAFSLFFFACKNDNSVAPDDTIDLRLIGVWDLTKISTNAAGQVVNYTPSELEISSTFSFFEDFTFESFNVNKDSTIYESGTWIAKAGVLTLTVKGKGSESNTYTFAKDKIYFGRLVDIEELGQVFATLEYKRRG